MVIINFQVCYCKFTWINQYSITNTPLLQPPAMPCLPRALHPTPDFVTPASAIARRKMEMYFLHWKTMKYQGQRGQLYLRACCVRRSWHLIGFGKRSLQKIKPLLLNISMHFVGWPRFNLLNVLLCVYIMLSHFFLNAEFILASSVFFILWCHMISRIKILNF